MKEIGRNIFSLGISRVISGAVLFIVYIWLARYFGPDNFGKFSLVLAYYTIFFLLIDLGISKYFIKKVSEDKNLAGVFLGNFFVAQFFLSLVVLVCFVLIPRILGYDQDITRAMFYAGFGLMFVGMSIPYASLVQAWQKIHLLAFVYFVNTLVNAAWLALAILLSKGIVFVFFVYTIIGILDILMYIVLTRKIIAPKFDLKKTVIKKMFVYGMPFAFLTGFEVLIQKVDVVIQKFFLPFYEVGLYSAAYRFVDILTFIPAIIAMSLFPFFASKADLDEQSVLETSNHFNRYAVMIALPLGVGGILLADKIILTIFSYDYFEAVSVLRILIWASAVSLMYVVPGIIMIVKKTRQSVYILAIASVFNIALNFILIPYYGIIASAWITTATYGIVAGLYIYYAYQIQKFTLFRYLFIPLLSAGLMSAVIWPLRELNLFLLIGIGVVVYGFLLVVTRFLNRDDWKFVLSIVGIK